MAKIAFEMKSKVLAPEKYSLVCSTQWKKRALRDIITSERISDFDDQDNVF